MPIRVGGSWAKNFLDLAAPQLPPQYRLLVLVNSMNLKDMFGRIQPILIIVIGRLLVALSHNHSLAHSMPSGPSTPTDQVPPADQHAIRGTVDVAVWLTVRSVLLDTAVCGHITVNHGLLRPIRITRPRARSPTPSSRRRRSPLLAPAIRSPTP